MLVPLLLSGCGPFALNRGLRDYGAVYANASNQQTLLNLARLANHHPAYFVQLGTVTSSYSATGNLGAGATRNDGDYIFGGNGSAGVAATSGGNFQIIPLGGGDFASQIVKPIPPEVFMVLYREGWRVDQLMRVLVERIEIHHADTNTTEVIGNNPSDPESYVRFLRTCELARYAQAAGALRLEKKNTEESVSPILAVPPSAKESVEGVEKNIIWKKVNGGWQAFKKGASPVFSLETSNRRWANRLVEDPAFASEKAKRAKENFFSLLAANGLKVRTSDEKSENAGDSAEVVIRSFNGALAAVALEQEAFQPFVRSHAEAIPAAQQRPILTLRWDAPPPGCNTLVQVTYNRSRYAIADVLGDGGQSSWNRDVFRLITQLYYQISVDISKYNQNTYFLSR